ncbi:MAG TPA: elongation factor 4, partial [candidate division WOR-3 bacterium]|nr:elongation factor 4 [candidate division WOR-3 bacterium]
GYREAKPMVFAGFYPTLSSDYPLLEKALYKLKLNDAALHFQGEYSPALGPGFRCGFLGMLHMEIVKERIKREFGVEVVITTPNVEYKVKTKDGKEIVVDSPKEFPDHYLEAYEPYVLAEIITPKEFLGNIQQLVMKRRGIQRKFQFLDENTVYFEFELPLQEIIFDFYDRLKSVSRGYASFDYEFLEFRKTDAVRLDFIVAGERVEALSMIVHRSNAYRIGRKIVEKLKREIPRHLFEVTIQAAIGNKIIAKERIAPLRKDVTAKCYGGDITRKRKLLEKQKEGKRRMKKIGRVELPQEAFLNVVRAED